MESETVSVQKLFQDRRQFRVPFFQRKYVWNRDDQWERLWQDISGKADSRVAGKPTTPHFLGATVVEPQLRTGLLGVDALHIIDGQQRLTTLQYVLAALAINLRSLSQGTLLTIVNGCLLNGNESTMTDPGMEVFKVWPTFRDREMYRLAMTAESLEDLRSRFPDSFTQGGSLRKIGIDHSPPLEAIWYFATEAEAWIKQEDESAKITHRAMALTESVLTDLHLVSISLGTKDDAQVIFETLNGHGAELHATDLIRNFVFMRADRENADPKLLYDNLWTPLEGDFWSEDQRRGRLVRPRLEWFMHSALQSETTEEIDVSRLYVAYKAFAGAGETAKPAKAQLEILNKLAGHYQQLISGIGAKPIARFGYRTRAWDASTTHSVALRIATSSMSAADQLSAFEAIESYLVRRSICGLTTKNYNNIFSSLLKKTAEEATITAAGIRSALASLEGDASRWPTDAEFLKEWVDGPAYYGRLDAQRIKAVLIALEIGMRPGQSEEQLPVNLEVLDVDHVLPTHWFEYWPLGDGSQATSTEAQEAYHAHLSGLPLTNRLGAIYEREAAKSTMGNLTLLHYGANRSLQHHAFPEKKAKFFEVSNLHLNRFLMVASDWNEAEIRGRAQKTFDVARKIWPGPSN
ncbi:MAG: DUF262 domain-containing protein [Reyranella sp.]|uniref:DUF262 domain-containing protein n=1 Tax=Reyranella sp. TaxID=1929291 RepID=UPI00120E80D5|nr:DUF262 domain-containing HNH endonuclease family protein [Reyranella sp.]TAJ41397.1 MAG: DUF262 domain-containing protein [Reyranella sp.]